jgi:hypothetical protein
MTERQSFPDDVPVDDAVEQLRSVAEPADPESVDDDAPPLESNESDWQEQRQVVEYPDQDEMR